MTEISPQLHEMRNHVQNAAKQISPFIERFARFGFAAKGIVYIVIGYLAALAPVGLRRHPTGVHGALVTLLRQPIGTFLLAVIAFGFATFGIWLILRGIADPEHEGQSWNAISLRIGWVFGGLTHFGLVIAAVHMIFGYATRDDEREAHDWTATALSYPLGRWIIAGVGVAILIYGLLQIHHGLLDKLDPRLTLHELSAPARKWIRGICRFGMTARGVVFGLLGVFLMRAAYDFNAHEARGLSGTLRAIASEPHGRAFLAIAAFGLMAYGVYMLVLGRYRRITAL
jgi:hypothetical protein